MLDLECTHADSFKPVIMEIGAVNFNIDTGEELSSFSTLINFVEKHSRMDRPGSKPGNGAPFARRYPGCIIGAAPDRYSAGCSIKVISGTSSLPLVSGL